jgi:outer membrane protein assembly factor BamB
MRWLILLAACGSTRPVEQREPTCWPLPDAKGASVAFGPRGEITVASSRAKKPIVFRYARDGSLLWQQALTVDASTDGLALDARGDAYLTGFSGTDCFIAKVADGRVAWQQSIAGTAEQYCRAIAVGADVYVTSAFGGSTLGLTSRGKSDIWVAAFATTDGTRKWVTQLGGAGNEISRALAIDAHGDIILGGQYSGEVPPAEGEMLGLRAAGDFDGLVAKLSPAGEVRWARGFGDLGFDIVKSVAVAPDGDIVASGAWMRPEDFTGKIPILVGVMDGVIARYAPDGTPRWRHVFTGGGSQAHHLALDADRIWLSGHFNGRVDLGGRVLESTEKSTAYMAAFASDGKPTFAERLPASYGYEIASDGAGRIAVAYVVGDATQVCVSERR